MENKHTWEDLANGKANILAQIDKIEKGFENIKYLENILEQLNSPDEMFMKGFADGIGGSSDIGEADKLKEMLEKKRIEIEFGLCISTLSSLIANSPLDCKEIMTEFRDSFDFLIEQTENLNKETAHIEISNFILFNMCGRLEIKLDGLKKELQKYD